MLQLNILNLHAESTRALRKAAFIDGLRTARPGLLALSVWGIVTGVAMVKSGLTETAAITMSLLVYAGSAQLTSLPLIESGAPLWLIFVVGLIVNLRFLIFGAALQPFFKEMSWPKRLLMGYLTVDISFVAFMPKYADQAQRGTTEQKWFYLATILFSWVIWQVTSVIGIALGTIVPTSWSLGFSAILALLAIVMPLITNRPMIFSVIVSALVAWIGQPLPLRLGLLLAVLAGIVAGMWADHRLLNGAHRAA